MGAVKDAITAAISDVYVYSIMIGDNIVEDEFCGYLGVADDQIQEVCDTLKTVPELQAGFNAVGFSQGGQFLRAFVERCNVPPVYNLVTMGGQHQGVADIPDCTSPNETICEIVEQTLALGAYNPIVQESVIQAQYFHDPMEPQQYLTYNKFLTDINNELTINLNYKQNLISLNNLILVQFADDTVVVPKESSWFGFYEDNNLNNILLFNQTRLYLEDRIGLKTLNENNKLKFDATPGNHMQFTLEWFKQHVILPYLDNQL
eukprot:TRINITY_DN2551_c0_g1_i1.p1 TRINITY_DN2551_c0_g1~~TRINITY_DN2551_c0_g1_i1.p1  ORF type:complete len:307 (+),score=68.37 TRINITY_DN2551_c0_g1_i1:139-921(+)